MRMLMVTRVAAVAVGLGLLSGMALAAPDGRRSTNENAGAVEQKTGDQDGRDRKGRNTKPVVNPAPTANQPYPGIPEAGARNERQKRSAERTRNKYEGVRNARGRDNQTDGARDNSDNRRNFGDRNGRRVWSHQNRRQQVNIQQYHRNFNAPRRYRAEVYRWRDGNSYRRYGYGQRLPRHYFIRNFWVANFLAYDLFSPPPGYVWVRYGPDALLIDQDTGEIVQVRYNMFYS